ncbi:MAG: hypothetical protein WCR54_08565 [Clostridia bacterium]
MELIDIKTLTEVSSLYKIPLKTLQSRLLKLEENIDYKKLGARQATILSPSGIRKITLTK